MVLSGTHVRIVKTEGRIKRAAALSGLRRAKAGGKPPSAEGTRPLRGRPPIGMDTGARDDPVV
ncbi:hypothetical protein J2S76_001549 [Ancylobacter vacuolatus]|uniref:Uncharacterized protein n=1 Tax=Ancylobacter vacuolatus TaxID=223389 RepID=A0ABU0DFD8_9HYPH|nr:hypothetical protein [Ancylobacter vacuolatus]